MSSVQHYSLLEVVVNLQEDETRVEETKAKKHVVHWRICAHSVKIRSNAIIRTNIRATMVPYDAWWNRMPMLHLPK